jgi:hypothetical protein
LRVADAEGTAVSGEGCQLRDLEFVYELVEARVVRAVQFELNPPGGCDYG